MLEKIHFIYFSFLLAISTQCLNFIIMKLNIDKTYSIWKQVILLTTWLLPIIYILNLLFNLYYKYYSTNVNYSILYMSFIIISIITSFFVQYFLYGTNELTIDKFIGIGLALIGIYLIIK